MRHRVYSAVQSAELIKASSVSLVSSAASYHFQAGIDATSVKNVVALVDQWDKVFVKCSLRSLDDSPDRKPVPVYLLLCHRTLRKLIFQGSVVPRLSNGIKEKKARCNPQPSRRQRLIDNPTSWRPTITVQACSNLVSPSSDAYSRAREDRNIHTYAVGIA